ncbi:SDR family oxidoreductase [Pseudomonas sp. DC3000-4b1]|uniref:SDR family oxidoreductase n=1 Tax=unclassified Pseudomonas TaxID=196821 RepID=UPI003CF6F41D
MAVPKVMIAGCGDIGTRLAVRLKALSWDVTGVRRDPARLPQGLPGLQADFNEAACPSQWPSEPVDYLVYAVAADQHDEVGYRRAYVQGLGHVLGWLGERQQVPRRLLFISSSSVYGQTEGEWVDETSPTVPTGYAGQVMLEAEKLAASTSIPATVVRLTGIYGPGRERLLNQARQGYRASAQVPQYGNRIHADDAAGLMAHLLERDWAGAVLGGCYLGVDDEPAPLHEVLDWLRQRMGVTAPYLEAPLRRTGSKRCSNAAARATGWAPRFPTYREGYAALLGADAT